MAAPDLLDITEATLTAQNLGEGSPGALVGAHQAMTKPGPGIEHLLQAPSPCELRHDFGINRRGI
jgi:hypothetical protein